ncbi:MAG: hypothetical protein ACYTJ0_02630 [Planctomycetota bacterium]
MPSKEKLEKEAARCNGVWHHWSQDDYLLGRTFGKGGVCAPLCVVFLRRQATGEGHFSTYVNSEEGRDVVMWLKSQQHGGLASRYAMDYLQVFGLKRAFSHENDSDVTILNYLKLKGFYLLGITDVEGQFADEQAFLRHIATQGIKGHALAVINDDPIFMVFDPNFGAGAFRTADDLTTFIGRYWTHVYRRLRGAPSLERYFKAA